MPRAPCPVPCARAPCPVPAPCSLTKISAMTRLRLRSCSRLVTLVGTLALASACGAPPPGDRPARNPHAARATRIWSRSSPSGGPFSAPRWSTACPTTPPARWRRSTRRSPAFSRASPPSIPAAGPSRSRPTTTSCAPRCTASISIIACSGRGPTTRRSTSRSSRARAISPRERGRLRTARWSSGAISFRCRHGDADAIADGRACRAGASRPGPNQSRRQWKGLVGARRS